MLCLTTHSSAFGTRVQERFRTESLRYLVRPDLDLVLTPGQILIRMMGFGLCDSSNLVRKRQREGIEGVEPLQRASPVESPAPAELLQQLPRAESV